MDADAPEQSFSRRKLVCPRYENVYEYIRLVERPLTGQEQRAFLYMLDLDAEDRYVHASEEDGHECICMDLLPTIVQALEPDPVDDIVAKRSLEGETYMSQRFHTERVGKFQGIVLNRKTQTEKTEDLKRRGNELLKDFEAVLREISSRKELLGCKNRKELLQNVFPKVLKLTSKVPVPRNSAVNLNSVVVKQHLKLHFDAARKLATKTKEDLEKRFIELEDAFLSWHITSH